MHEPLAARRAEFASHLWDHTTDPFQTGFDERRPLSEEELSALRQITAAVGEGKSDEALADVILGLTRYAPEVLLSLMQVCGLTRNKIITDLRASVATAGMRVPATPAGLPRSPVWRIAGPYLAFRLRKVLEPLTGRTAGPLDDALEALNQATWPGYIRQQRAKMQGHEAEFRLATLLVALDLPFEPLEKADNPLCRDAQLHGVSFDLVVPSVREPRVCLKSTVQTSNIGQFGESKGALEVTEAQDMLARRYAESPALVAMVDGVGFRSNRAGLDGILERADEFCQFATAWKFALVAAASVGLGLEVGLPAGHEQEHASFLERYLQSVRVVPLADDTRAQAGAVGAGEAIVIRR